MVRKFTQQFNVKRFFYLIKYYFKFIFINCIIFYGVVGHANPVGDSKKGAVIAQGLCSGCHAADGNSVIPMNPIIAGQHADYLKKQHAVPQLLDSWVSRCYHPLRDNQNTILGR